MYVYMVTHVPCNHVHGEEQGEACTITYTYMHTHMNTYVPCNHVHGKEQGAGKITSAQTHHIHAHFPHMTHYRMFIYRNTHIPCNHVHCEEQGEARARENNSSEKGGLEVVGLLDELAEAGSHIASRHSHEDIEEEDGREKCSSVDVCM